MKGLKVLSNIPDFDYFSKILGYEEYKAAIENTNGDKESLKNVFWKVLADDYLWEFINGEIILRGGMTLKACGANQNLMFTLLNFVNENDLGEVFGGRSICDFGENFFSPNIIYFDNKKSKIFKGNTNRFPVPDFILECNDDVCEEQNRGIKFEEYAKYGVGEYWMLNPNKETIEQYALRKGSFDFVGIFKENEIIESGILRGFKISPTDIFNNS